MIAAALEASSSLPAPLPDRYVCTGCGVCIATSDGLTETRQDTIVFACLYVSENDADKGGKTVMCPGCGQAIGSKADTAFVIRSDRVAKRTERLEILVCSLKQQEITDVVPALQDVFPHSNISTRVLLKAELRGIDLRPTRPPLPEFVVVVHRNEGRALLTDRNGFYHDALGSAWRHTAGQAVLILTRAPPRAETDLFDTQLVTSLSTQGDQPTVGALSGDGRVITWETSPSTVQACQLRRLAVKAYFKEPTIIVPGVPSTWCKPLASQSAFGGNSGRTGSANGSSSWCSLL